VFGGHLLQNRDNALNRIAQLEAPRAFVPTQFPEQPPPATPNALAAARVHLEELQRPLEFNAVELPRQRGRPVRLAFSITINKSQGQSVDHIGLDLCTDVFAHGQLYVALSRCTSSQRVKALFK
jgi:hypothetical protein